MGSVESGPIVDKLQRAGRIKTTYANNPTQTNKDDLLNTMIKKVSIIIQPLGVESENGKEARVFISEFLPSSFSFSNISHAGLFIYGNDANPKDGILLEYGAYDEKREGDYDSQVHYFRKDNGLRFTKLNIDNIPGYKYECDVEYHMTLNELCTCLEFRHFSKQKYNLIDQNCQYFVRKSIKILGSKRTRDIDRIRRFSKAIIPDRILDVLEENEGSDNFGERIPIIGMFVSFYKLSKA